MLASESGTDGKAVQETNYGRELNSIWEHTTYCVLNLIIPNKNKNMYFKKCFALVSFFPPAFSLIRCLGEKLK